MSKEKLEKLGQEMLLNNEQFHEFEINIKGYKGKFKCKNQTIADTLSIIALARKMTSKMGLAAGEDPMYEQLVTEIATLETLLVERPEWFEDIMHLYDWEVIHAVHEEVVKFVNSFRTPKGSDS
jgi:hypothetical protein